MEVFKITDKSALEKNNMCSNKNCKKLLNVPPIFCSEEDGIVTKICGRCSDSSDTVNLDKKCRQYAFENMAQFLTFPCCNKKFGCEAILNWNQVSDHEIVCAFKPILCPFSYNDLFPSETKRCNWMGNVTKINEHIETSHIDYILNPPYFDWDDFPHVSGYNHIYFTNLGVQLVTLVIKNEEQKIYCLVMLNGNDVESQCFRYQLEVFDENKENSIIFRKNRLEPLGSMIENFNNLAKMLEIDTNLLKNSKISYGRFGIVKKNEKEILQITGSKDLGLPTTPAVIQEKVLPIDETMLQELECPVCNEFMTPPIFICQTGHSICDECQSKIRICPNCRCNFSGARNFTLEKLTMKVNYPCRNREIGCSFVTTAEKIKKHETFCELAEISCIVGCKHKCLKQGMYEHLSEKHPKSFIQADTLLVRDADDKRESFYVLYTAGELFRFSVIGSALNPFKFNVQHMGMIENEPKYRYQLQIIDQSPLKLNLSVTIVCQCLTDIPNEAHETALNIPWDLLKPLVCASKIFYYKIIINKL